MATELVYIVAGIIREFDGATRHINVGVRRDEKEARELGHKWMILANEDFKSEGSLNRASYELEKWFLI